MPDLDIEEVTVEHERSDSKEEIEFQLKWSLRADLA